MELASLKCESRTTGGSRAAARLRKTGKVPGIVYGHGETPMPVAVSQHDLEIVLHQGRHLLELDLDGQKHRVLVKDVQYDHLGTTPVHVDLTRVSLDERVQVTVALDFRGTPQGVKEGGILDQTISDVEIECLVTEIPTSIRVDVSELALSQSLHVSDLVLPPGVKAITGADLVVCTVRPPVTEEAATAAAPEEGPAEPELIRKEKPEADEEAESSK